MASTIQVTIALAVIPVLGMAAYMYLGSRKPVPVLTRPVKSQQRQ